MSADRPKRGAVDLFDSFFFASSSYSSCLDSPVFAAAATSVQYRRTRALAIRPVKRTGMTGREQ
jgi:hypothetical protein